MPTLEMDRLTQAVEAPEQPTEELIGAAVVPQLGLIDQLIQPSVQQEMASPDGPLELDFSRDFTPPVPDTIMAGLTTTRTSHPEGSYADDAESDD